MQPLLKSNIWVLILHHQVYIIHKNIILLGAKMHRRNVVTYLFPNNKR